MNNSFDEQEYRIPVKVLTDRDPIIAGRFSMRELGQWIVVLGLLYLTLNILPGPFQIKAVLAAFLLMGGVIFIHIPVNGLAGIEWVFVAMRYRLERPLHDAEATPVIALAATGPKLTFTLASTGTTSSTNGSGITSRPMLVEPAPGEEEDEDEEERALEGNLEDDL